MAVESAMVPLGSSASTFALPDTDGKTISMDDFAASPALLVMFICNHCPYVRHVEQKLGELARKFQDNGVAVVGINANDPDAYPEDAPAGMIDQIQRASFSFPYLIDTEQKVAKEYKAACTPDFFLYDQDHKLVYRGQFDDARPGNNVVVTGEHLKAAVDALLSGREIPQQYPSIGCSIKWRPGNEPDYAQ